MNLEEVKSKQFSTAKRGYSPQEVDNFILELANELEEKQNRINTLNTKLKDYYKIDKKLRDTLLLLNEPVKDSLIKAKEQAGFIIKEATAKSEELILSAENEAKSTRDTLLFLKEQKELLITRLKIIIEAQEGLLNDFLEGIDNYEFSRSVLEKKYSDESPEIKIEKILEKLI